MEVVKTAIDGVLIIEPKVFGDKRGYFFESFSQREFDQKVENIACFIKNLRADAAALKAEKEALQKRQKAAEAKAESLTRYLSAYLAGAKFSSPKASVTWRKTTRVEMDPGVNILSIPNEEYVFYQIDAAGQVKVLIAGWGSTNYKKPIIGNERVAVEDKGAHPISIAFTIDDEKVPNRNFSIVTSLKNVPHTTDANGDYALGKINADTSIEFIDEPTGKRFNILTDRTTTEYTFDITERVNVRIEASHDNEPISDEEASIDYHGRTYKVMLEAGQATVGLALYPGEVCTARFRGAMQQQELNPAGHTFRFDSTTPPPPPEPEPEPEPEPGRYRRTA